MNRRKFVSLGTASLCVMPVLGFSAFNKKEYGMETTKPTWLSPVHHSILSALSAM